jgi:hypothetical protein
MTITVETARQEGINFLYINNQYDPKAGAYTLAYRECPSYAKRKGGKMVEVAVAYCSIGDTFDKKTGRSLALRNFIDGKTITVPALIEGAEYMHHYLRQMFSFGIDY